MAPRDKAAVAKNTLVDSVLKLEAHYGAPGPPPTTDPFEMIVWENAAYLVDDTRRRTVFELLRRKVGMVPEAIAAAPLEKLAAVIETGGMRPAMRAGKLRTAAALALEIGLARLREAVRSSPAEARKATPEPTRSLCSRAPGGAWRPTRTFCASWCGWGLAGRRRTTPGPTPRPPGLSRRSCSTTSTGACALTNSCDATAGSCASEPRRAAKSVP